MFCELINTEDCNKSPEVEGTNEVNEEVHLCQ
jgi:hypothetical protein